METGQKALCPCGNGEKYKECYMNEQTPPADLLWRSLGYAYDQLKSELIKFGEKHFGELALLSATEEFLLWPEDKNLMDSIKDHDPYFMPWFLFNWVYDHRETDIALGAPAGQTIAQTFSQEESYRLDTFESMLLETIGNKPFSFYEIMSCRPGLGVRLKGIFTDEETDVGEKMGLGNVQIGNIILARIVQVDHISILAGTGSMIFPFHWKPEIMQLKTLMLVNNQQITDEVLNEFDLEIRELYLQICHITMKPPTLFNTGG